MATNTIYPPIIEGILPAFIKDQNGKGQLIVPFTFNSATTQADWDGAVIKVKTIQEDLVITQAETTNIDKYESWAIFDLQKETGEGKALGEYFDIGVHYKVQLALKKGNNIGWFSSVGVIKCTSKPSITIFGGGGEFPSELFENYGNQNYPSFIGVYSQKGDTEDTYSYDINERVYSSYFELFTKDEDGNKILVERSEEVIHNASLDEELNESREEWYPTIDLTSGINYYVKYYVKTINNLECSSPSYPVFATEAVPLDIPADLEVEYDEENGVAALYFRAHSKSARATGRFVISRKDLNLDDNWRIIYRFALATELPDGLIWRDFTVEQGSTYSYAIQQYNESNVYTGRKIFTYYNENGFPHEEITIKFEHMYLFDGEKQLKIKFNPQVSSFKDQLFEQKVDTIGSKYPFFFRNGVVKYKTFPISGLVSMLSDDDELFTSFDSIERPKRNSLRSKTPQSSTSLYNYDETDLNWKNVESERLFKLKVLDWLNDGKLKLFRSPQEGNYLVRLMENSLTPVAGLGRMLHTFNSTAYEADDTSYNTLLKHKIISIPTDLNTDTQKVTTVQLKDFGVYDKNGNIQDLLRYNITRQEDGETITVEKSRYSGPITRIDLRDLLPGTQIKITFRDGTVRVITIGKTGAYTVKGVSSIIGLEFVPLNKTIQNKFENSSENMTVFTNIYGRNLTGSATVYYESTSLTGFDSIANEKVDPQACVQIIGNQKNFPTSLSNIREKFVKINFLHVHKRDIVNLYVPMIIDNDTKQEVVPFSFREIISKERTYMPDDAKNLLYFDRDCRTKVFIRNKQTQILEHDDNLVPNALYNIRFVRPNDLAYSYGADLHPKPQASTGGDMAIAENMTSSASGAQGENTAIDISFVSKSDTMEYADRRSGDLFWQNDLFAEKHPGEEELFYLNYGDFLYDAESNQIIFKDDWNPSFTLHTKEGSTTIDLRETESYKLKNLIPNENFLSIDFGNGVYADCFYQNLILTYVFQNSSSKYYDEKVGKATNEYEEKLQSWTNQDNSSFYEELEELKNEMLNLLQEYYDDWISLKEV